MSTRGDDSTSPSVQRTSTEPGRARPASSDTSPSRRCPAAGSRPGRAPAPARPVHSDTAAPRRPADGGGPSRPPADPDRTPVAHRVGGRKERDQPDPLQRAAKTPDMPAPTAVSGTGWSGTGGCTAPECVDLVRHGGRRRKRHRAVDRPVGGRRCLAGGVPVAHAGHLLARPREKSPGPRLPPDGPARGEPGRPTPNHARRAGTRGTGTVKGGFVPRRRHPMLPQPKHAAVAGAVRAPPAHPVGRFYAPGGCHSGQQWGTRSTPPRNRRTAS